MLGQFPVDVRIMNRDGAKILINPEKNLVLIQQMNIDVDQTTCNCHDHERTSDYPWPRECDAKVIA